LSLLKSNQPQSETGASRESRLDWSDAPQLHPLSPVRKVYPSLRTTGVLHIQMTLLCDCRSLLLLRPVVSGPDNAPPVCGISTAACTRCKAPIRSAMIQNLSKPPSDGSGFFYILSQRSAAQDLISSYEAARPRAHRCPSHGSVFVFKYSP